MASGLMMPYTEGDVNYGPAFEEAAKQLESYGPKAGTTTAENLRYGAEWITQNMREGGAFGPGPAAVRGMVGLMTVPEWKQALYRPIQQTGQRFLPEVAERAAQFAKSVPTKIMDTLKWIAPVSKTEMPKQLPGLVGKQWAADATKYYAEKGIPVMQKMAVGKEGAGFFIRHPEVGSQAEYWDTAVHETIHHIHESLGIKWTPEIEKKVKQAANQIMAGKPAPYYEHLLELANMR